ncbi:MAG: hypothetical protein AAGH65_05170 [Pseudomonadota bacterium]
MSMKSPERPYLDRNLFTYQGQWDGQQFGVQLMSQLGAAADGEQFDLGMIEVDEVGEFIEPNQLELISARIRAVRDQGQAIVVGFIHGWHNNADWDNANLESFRKLLKALMIREIELHNRRVIGVYIGWNGQPKRGVGQWISRIPGIKHATFRDRYRAAERTGQGDAMAETLVELSHACKMDGPPGTEAPLILIGHSMGAFILQSTFRELLEHNADPLIMPTDDQPSPVSIKTRQHAAVSMPDLLLSLNSAAESDVAKDIIRLTRAQEWEKCFTPPYHCSAVHSYAPPVLISVTSEQDQATNWVWRAGHFFQKTSTDGHDAQLATHDFVRSNDVADCAPSGFPDFGQPWHCLHQQYRPEWITPLFRIDLPDHDRTSDQPLTHTAYELKAKQPDRPNPFWLFQVPGDIIEDHGDVFNFKAASFTLALIQISGVLASAAGSSWTDQVSECNLAADD